jgi:Ras-related protein Rab-18
MDAKRGAHGVLLVYDVTDRASFDALKDVWLKEVTMAPAAVIKMIVGNKVDLPDRTVTREEGIAFAREQSTLFVEASAKTAVGVQQTFEELVRKILQTPELCASDSNPNGAVRPGTLPAGAESSYSDCAC